ncbi:MAG: hypothetical protein M3437_07900 [Chloroflexota bacterium]|nr:hypothetical protein [Chloroflexota bacterium]MDQ5864450.1 hypothetical protein [Chloroflexota bacterium]
MNNNSSDGRPNNTQAPALAVDTHLDETQLRERLDRLLHAYGKGGKGSNGSKVSGFRDGLGAGTRGRGNYRRTSPRATKYKGYVEEGSFFCIFPESECGPLYASQPVVYYLDHFDREDAHIVHALDLSPKGGWTTFSLVALTHATLDHDSWEDVGEETDTTDWIRGVAPLAGVSDIGYVAGGDEVGDSIGAVIFAETLDELLDEIEQRQRRPLPELEAAVPNGLPAEMLAQARRMVELVTRVEDIVAQEEAEHADARPGTEVRAARAGRVGGSPGIGGASDKFSRTEAVKKAVSKLVAEGVGEGEGEGKTEGEYGCLSVSTYYRWRSRCLQHNFSIPLIASGMRRRTRGHTRMTKAQMHMVDKHILEYRHLRPARLYNTLYSTWRWTRGRWIDPALCRDRVREDLAAELLDHARVPMQAILNNPEKAMLLTRVVLPSRAWFFLRYEMLKAQPDLGRKVTTERYGKELWDASYRVFDSFVRRAQLPLQFVFADHYLLDVFVVDPQTRKKVKRLWLTVLIDAYSRAILGFALLWEEPCIESVQSALQHAIWPKSPRVELQRAAANNAYTTSRYTLDELAALSAEATGEGEGVSISIGGANVGDDADASARTSTLSSLYAPGNGPLLLSPDAVAGLPYASYGIPQALFLDNAWAHHSHSLEALAREISMHRRFTSIDLVFRPPYMARLGALVERLFGNLSGRIKEHLRGAGAIQASNPKAVREAAERACLLYWDVYRIIYILILEYMHTPHRELNGLTPNQQWLHGTASIRPRVPSLTEAVRRRFWRLMPGTRLMTRQGICAFGLHYKWSGSAQPAATREAAGKDAERDAEGQKVDGTRRGEQGGLPLFEDNNERVRYCLRWEPRDIRRVALFQASTGKYVGDLYADELRQADDTYLPCSIWQWTAAKQLAGPGAAKQQVLDLIQFENENRALQEERRAEQRNAGRRARKKAALGNGTAKGRGRGGTESRRGRGRGGRAGHADNGREYGVPTSSGPLALPRHSSSPSSPSSSASSASARTEAEAATKALHLDVPEAANDGYNRYDAHGYGGLLSDFLDADAEADDY